MRATLLAPIFAAAFALACAGDRPSHATHTAAPAPAAKPEVTATTAEGDQGFLAPNAEDSDGTPMYVHYTQEDMPLRVDVQLPKLAARYASREETDTAVIEAIRGWEAAIQPVLPWFKLEIVRGQPDANIRVEWKTRITGDASGWGGLGWSIADGRLRARGELQYATKPCLAIECQLDLGQLKLLVTHEFGHTLGLRHCLECDSAMNYSWETRERVLITELDVRTIRALYEMPNGTRADGKLALGLRPRSGQ
jgi:predicted Zn-dependent protease